MTAERKYEYICTECSYVSAKEIAICPKCNGPIVVEDIHRGCPAYPDCHMNPLGCAIRQGDANVEWYFARG
jgi:ssDNA-binding Zn-finger/Zn-ribbon topoisomerase 1